MSEPDIRRLRHLSQPPIILPIFEIETAPADIC